MEPFSFAFKEETVFAPQENTKYEVTTKKLYHIFWCKLLRQGNVFWHLALQGQYFNTGTSFLKKTHIKRQNTRHGIVTWPIIVNNPAEAILQKAAPKPFLKKKQKNKFVFY